ncbi:ribonuclease HI family protein [Candidatus Omnitrophota bacterium]
MKKLNIYIDGASKGNPGPAGIGVVISCDGEVLKNISVNIGIATNNFAEYTALIYALQEALIMKAEELYIKSDSLLLCKQINREYKVKNVNIIRLYKQAQHLITAFKQVKVSHIRREFNSGADKLANQAVKKA